MKGPRIEGVRIDDIQHVATSEGGFLEVSYSATSREAGEHFPEVLRKHGLDARLTPPTANGRKSFSMSDVPAEKYNQIFRKAQAGNN